MKNSARGSNGIGQKCRLIFQNLEKNTAMDKDGIKLIYRKRASAYNNSIKLFNLIGWRVNFYRIKAVDALNLKKGDTVVDLCCGTGLNFPHLQNAIGAEGKIIGVDLSSDMLKVAERQVKNNGWGNVTLVNSDAAQYQFPKNINGIVTSYAITLIPEYDSIITRGSYTLSKGGRFVILDFKKPDSWPEWFSKLMLALFIKPYGGTYELKDRHAWKSLEKHLRLIEFKEFYWGSTYIATGEKI
jgi:demethylmenaquinone methyltransferase/2-methoxy-6-polyprenyl-1,4-benzoquinol methylase